MLGLRVSRQSMIESTRDTMKYMFLWRWLLVALLWCAATWTANLMAFNWWAAAGPPTPTPEQYEHKGNLFFAATCVLFGAGVLISYFNFRRLRANGASRGQKSPS